MATGPGLTRPVAQQQIVNWLLVSLHLDIEDLSAFHCARTGVDSQAVGLHVNQPGSTAKNIFHVDDAAELPASRGLRAGHIAVERGGGQRVSDSGRTIRVT